MSSSQLKTIAVIAMTIDHAAKIIGQAGMLFVFPNMSLRASMLIIRVMEVIGRIAFPLFAFALAEGAHNTHSMPKYIGRLSIFAIISEPAFYFSSRIPFFYFSSRIPFSPKPNIINSFLENLSRFNLENIFFTLALAAITLYIYQLFSDRNSRYIFLKFTPILMISALVGEYINCDYGAAGIFLIIALYFAKTKPQKGVIILIWSIWLYILGQAFTGNGFAWTQVSIYHVADCISAALSFIPIWFYNGKRGKSVKWSFYVYYPAHLLLLACLKVLML